MLPSVGLALQIRVRLRGVHSSHYRFGGHLEALLPPSRQVILIARTLQSVNGRLIGCTFIFKLCCVTAWAAEHHFNMQIDSSEALHYAFSGLFSD